MCNASAADIRAPRVSRRWVLRQLLFYSSRLLSLQRAVAPQPTLSAQLGPTLRLLESVPRAEHVASRPRVQRTLVRAGAVEVLLQLCAMPTDALSLPLVEDGLRLGVAMLTGGCTAAQDELERRLQTASAERALPGFVRRFRALSILIGVSLLQPAPQRSPRLPVAPLLQTAASTPPAPVPPALDHPPPAACAPQLQPEVGSLATPDDANEISPSGDDSGLGGAADAEVASKGGTGLETATACVMLSLRLVQAACDGPCMPLQLAFGGAQDSDAPTGRAQAPLLAEASRWLLQWEHAAPPALINVATEAARTVYALCYGPCEVNVGWLSRSALPACAARLLSRQFDETRYAPSALRRLRAALAAVRRHDTIACSHPLCIARLMVGLVIFSCCRILTLARSACSCCAVVWPPRSTAARWRPSSADFSTAASCSSASSQRTRSSSF